MTLRKPGLVQAGDKPVWFSCTAENLKQDQEETSNPKAQTFCGSNLFRCKRPSQTPQF